MASASVRRFVTEVNAPGPAGTLAQRRPVDQGPTVGSEMLCSRQEGEVSSPSTEGRDPADPAPGQYNGGETYTGDSYLPPGFVVRFIIAGDCAFVGPFSPPEEARWFGLCEMFLGQRPPSAFDVIDASTGEIMSSDRHSIEVSR